MVRWVLDTHGLVVPTYGYDRVGGFGAGELCASLSLPETGTLSPTIQVSQNRRNLHLLVRIQDFFGCGGIRAYSLWNNSSTFEWKDSGKGNGYRLIRPELRMFAFTQSKTW